MSHRAGLGCRPVTRKKFTNNSGISVPVPLLWPSHSQPFIFHSPAMAQVKFDRVFLHSYVPAGQGVEYRISRLLIWTKPPKKTRGIRNVHCWKLLDIPDWTWNESLTKSEMRVEYQEKPGDESRFLLIKMGSIRKTSPLGKGARSVQDQKGLRHEFGKQGKDFAEALKRLYTEMEEEEFKKTMDDLRDIISPPTGKYSPFARLCATSSRQRVHHFATKGHSLQLLFATEQHFDVKAPFCITMMTRLESLLGIKDI